MKSNIKKIPSQSDLLVEYFRAHPNVDIPHPEVVDWVTREFLKRTGRVFRDPDRGVRKMHQEGMLIKVGKGVYRYDPAHVRSRHLEDFTPELKEKIFKRDGYKCVICGRGRKEGMEIHADHIKAKEDWLCQTTMKRRLCSTVYKRLAWMPH